VRVHRRDAERELVEVRLAGVHVACGLEASDDVCALGRNVVGEDDRPVGRRDARGVEEILDGETDTVACRLDLGDPDALERQRTSTAIATKSSAR
jgi:hypothetical protein